MTKITLQSWDATVTVEVDRNGLNIQEMLDELVKPALLAIGYPSGTIEEYFDDE